MRIQGWIMHMGVLHTKRLGLVRISMKNVQILVRVCRGLGIKRSKAQAGS